MSLIMRKVATLNRFQEGKNISDILDISALCEYTEKSNGQVMKTKGRMSVW